MTGEAQLEALLEIIITSARQAIVEYKKNGNEVPTIYSKEYHPVDFENDTVALKKAIRLLEGACHQLCASLAPPQHTVQNLSMPFEWACMSVVLRSKVADVLEKYPEGLHVDQLSTLLNLEKGKLARVLRLVATKGCFTEVTPNTFANNRLSLVTRSTSGSGAFLHLQGVDIAMAAPVLYETMTDPEYAASYHPEKAPIIYALKQQGFDGGFFDWMRINDERREVYHNAMTGLGQVTGALSILHHYPWNEVKTFCDIGASIGTVSIPLSKTYPHLKITNHDLPEVMAQAKDAWAKDAPEALRNNRIVFGPLNFFEESPVPDQDVYYLRNIIHDWPDAEAVVILRNIRKAMAPHSRLLIHDYLLVPVCRDPNAKSFGGDVAPEPMLPNFGNGRIRMYQQDVDMWFAHNAKERMLDESIALGSAAGLRLEKVYDLAESSVLEFRVCA